MEINFKNLNQAVGALRQCADEHEKSFTSTMAIRVSDLCNDVADFLESYSFHSLVNASENGITNKEFQDMLKQYPEDAKIAVECCNPKSLKYFDRANTIYID